VQINKGKIKKKNLIIVGILSGMVGQVAVIIVVVWSWDIDVIVANKFQKNKEFLGIL
jgi:hypothetical protein